VFSIPVEGSTVDNPLNYYGRVRAVDTSGNVGEWTEIKKTDQSTPLIDEQFIVSLTADRIKAGTIESAEIVLGGASPQNTVIKSSTYDGTLNPSTGQWSTGSAGWLISGNGQAIFDATQIRGSIAAGSINLNTHNYWLPSGSTANFKVGSSTKYMLFDGTNLTFTGDLSAAGGNFQGRLQAGDIYIPNTSSPVFSVTTAGALTASTGSIAGIQMSSGRLYSGAGSWNNSNTNFYLDQNGYFSLKDRLSWNPATNALSIVGSILSSTISGSTITAESGGNGIRITSDGFLQTIGSDGIKVKNSGGTTGSTIILAESITTGTFNGITVTVEDVFTDNLIASSDISATMNSSTATDAALQLYRSGSASNSYFAIFRRLSDSVEAGKIQYAARKFNRIIYYVFR